MSIVHFSLWKSCSGKIEEEEKNKAGGRNEDNTWKLSGNNVVKCKY